MTAAFIIALLTACGLGLACWAQRREIERLRKDAADADADRQRVADKYGNCVETMFGYAWVLSQIADATRNGKSGTARMVHRMAQEGLGLAPVPVANGGTDAIPASAAMQHLVGKGTQQ